MSVRLALSVKIELTPIIAHTIYCYVSQPGYTDSKKESVDTHLQIIPLDMSIILGNDLNDYAKVMYSIMGIMGSHELKETTEWFNNEVINW